MNFEVIADHPCGTKVDLYIPSNWSKSKNFNSEESINESSANVIIFTHGGAWVTNSRSDFEFFDAILSSESKLSQQNLIKTSPDLIKMFKNRFQKINYISVLITSLQNEVYFINFVSFLF